MGASVGRPVLNNFELVSRGIRLINRSLQDHVIAKMTEKYGIDWWKNKIYPRTRDFGMPPYTPSNPDEDLGNIRSFMDVTFCLKVIEEYRLDPDASRAPDSPLGYVRKLRNNISHFGGTDYTEAMAVDAINQLVIIADVFDADCKDEMWELLLASFTPMTVGSPEQTPAQLGETRGPKPVQPRERSRDNLPARAAAAEGERDEGAAPERVRYVSDDDCSPQLAALEACRSMLRDLSDAQATKKEVSRFTSEVVAMMPEDDHYILRLRSGMTVDDTMGFIADGRDFTGAEVSFDRYDGATKTVHMYPGEELRKVLEGRPKKMSVFTDMKWLVSRTVDFFEGFLPFISKPPVPISYSPSILAKDARLSEEQRAAVRMAMSEPLSYVWGVPGSGKTQSVLAASIGECVRRGERVAVIAPTNVALEQVLRGLLDAFEGNPAYKDLIDPARDVLRVGTPTAEFAVQYPQVCEDQGLRRRLIAKTEEYVYAFRTMLERRYEELRGMCEECVRDAKGNRPKDVSGRRRLMERMEPLLRLMREDERFRDLASGVAQASIATDIPRIADALYNRDRSMYLEGDLASKDDDELGAWISTLEEQIDALRSKDPSERQTAKVIAMTLSKFIVSYGPLGDERRKGLSVDHVFVDEAGYCNCLQTLALFTLDAPITMLGDHMQLPPVCEIRRDFMVQAVRALAPNRYDFLWDMSALYVEHMLDRGMSRISEMYVNSEEPDFVRTAHSELTVTYRFGPNLADALSRHVYPAGMRSASERDLEVIVLPAVLDAFPLVNGEAVRENAPEAEVVVSIACALDPDGFAILTPYRDQFRLIQRVDSTLKDNLLTIHSSQGREWDTVIISVVDGRANTEEKPPRFTSSQRVEGRLDGLKVINTALSRAKSRLYLVCDAESWAGKPDELLGDIVRSYWQGYRGRGADQGSPPKSG